MLKSLTKAILLLFVLSAVNLPAFAASDVVSERPGIGEMAGDLLLRPVYMGVTTLSTGVFILGSPFSLLGGNFGESFNVLVAQPFATTFFRCLGCQDRDRSLKTAKE